MTYLMDTYFNILSKKMKDSITRIMKRLEES